jgi:5-aminolevulinate synthase
MISHFVKQIEKLKAENRYREFVDISRLCLDFPYAVNHATGEKVIVWCSNDYLGMGQNSAAISAAKNALDCFGVGAGGTRNISGNNHSVVELEKQVAAFHGREMALTFTSGYVANDATIQALAQIIPDLVIFSDAKNHASIISGIRNSRASKHVFLHNDMEDLRQKLAQYPKSQPKIIIFESVYSMDGDFGKIAEIIALAKEFGALTYVDEVHSVGLYGKTGAGLCQQLDLEKDIDILQGTFAKAFGVIGGYIAGGREIIDAIRLTAAGFIFSTALPPAIAAAISANLSHLQNSDAERKKMHENVALVKNLLRQSSINFLQNESHIISIAIGDAAKAKAASKRLLDEFGIYVQHINYPTVAKGDERLRITVTPLHSKKMIEDLVTALTQIFS